MTLIYGAVDESPDPQAAAGWQERINSWPAIRAYKRQTYEHLADASLILDVGCGPGTDAASLGTARTIGLDPSTVMCHRAATRRVTVCCGDATALPFADQTFDGCRADRVLQHLADPAAALRELVRVTRRGGRIVVADPDQESLTIHVPGVGTAMIDRVKQLRRDVGYRNGRLASRLPALLTDLGLTGIEATAHPLLLTEPDDALGLHHWPRRWRDPRIAAWTEEDVRTWEDALDACQDNGFLFLVVYLVTVARRP